MKRDAVKAPQDGITSHARPWLRYAAAFLLVAGYLVHFSYLYRAAVDVPVMDEWEMLTSGGLQDGLSLRWLLAFHNEHRIVLTKLLIWLGLKLDSWNLITQQVFNYLLFGVMLWLICLLKGRVTGRREFPLFPAFLLFLLSDVIWYNHVMGFQSQFHLVIILLFTGAWYGFAPEYRNRNIVVFALCGIVSMYTFSQGVINAIILWCFLGLHLREQHRQSPLTARQKAVIAGSLLLTASAAFSWFIGYGRPENHPRLTLPFEAGFWDFFLNLLSSGFGIGAVNWQIGLFLLVVIVSPVCWMFSRRDRVRGGNFWLLTALLACLLAALAVIAASRASFGVEYAKNASRYAEFTFLLVPLTALFWWLVLRHHRLARNGLLAVFWLFCLYSYRDCWDLAFTYDDVRQNKLNGLQCLEAHCLGQSDEICRGVYDKPLENRLETARKMRLSFVRSLDACREQQLPLAAGRENTNQ